MTTHLTPTTWRNEQRAQLAILESCRRSGRDKPGFSGVLVALTDLYEAYQVDERKARGEMVDRLVEEYDRWLG